jgi:hypothetical protein
MQTPHETTNKSTQDPQTTKGAQALAPDDLWTAELAKPITRGGKMYVSPFGVIMGENLSGQDRAASVLNDKAFMATIEKFGVIQPDIVRKIYVDDEET